MSAKVSVILPTFNRAGLIAETLDSLLAQTRPVDEILVVDDGSSDATGEVVAGYGDHVTYLRKENGGKASALNLGLERISGDLVWICDDDDLIEPEACARLVGALEADPGLDYCAGRHEDFTVEAETGEKRIKPPGYWRASKPDEIFSDLLDGCHVFQPGLIVRRSHYDRIGPFNAELTRSQDYEMMLRIARHGRGRLLPERVFLHREHAGERGSASERFSAEQMTAKWIKFHRIIMGPLLAELADWELLAASIWNATPEGERARLAAVKRASTHARHMMWPEALAGFRALARSEGGAFSETERALILGSTQSNFGCTPLYQPGETREAALALKNAGPMGRDILTLLARSLHWRARAAFLSRDVAMLGQIAGFIAQARL